MLFETAPPGQKPLLAQWCIRCIRQALINDTISTDNDRYQQSFLCCSSDRRHDTCCYCCQRLLIHHYILFLPAMAMGGWINEGKCRTKPTETEVPLRRANMLRGSFVAEIIAMPIPTASDCGTSALRDLQDTLSLGMLAFQWKPHGSD